MRYNIAAMLANRSTSKTEPSTLQTHIVDGSIEYSRTFHAEDPYHGRFMPQKRTFHARGRYHGRFASLKSAYYTWQRKCLRAKRCQSLTGNIQYTES